MKASCWKLSLSLLLAVASSVSASPISEQRIALINKWHYGLFSSDNFELLPVLLSACISDPILKDIVEEQEFGKEWTPETVDAVSHWALDEIAHTQFLETFTNNPGNDPWGVVDQGPTYKKLLPCEMRAMSMFSGKYTGKCTSITHFLYGIFSVLGMKSGDCVVLRLDGHTVALLKLEGACYLVNNNQIRALTDSLTSEVLDYECLGFYTDRVSYKGPFKLKRKMLESKQRLADSIIDGASIKISTRQRGNDDVGYAKQTLLVEDPDLYVEASMRGPLVRALATELKGMNSIFEWMDDNIATAHVLTAEASVQTADQTIVYRSGNNADLGLLALTILRLGESKAELAITVDDAYLIGDSYTYSVKNRSEVEDIAGRVLYHLK